MMGAVMRMREYNKYVSRPHGFGQSLARSSRCLGLAPLKQPKGVRKARQGKARQLRQDMQ